MAAPAQTITPNEEKRSINWGALIFWPFVILLLYVLSIGPVLTMSYKRGSGADQFLGKFYAPLEWANEHTPLHKPLRMYMDLWTGPGIKEIR